MPASINPGTLSLVTRALAPDYEVIREIGRGGMGVVYLAREVALHREVAVKVLPPHERQDSALAERFLKEARTGARLEHPHIVPIYQVQERDGLVFFTMKHVSGPSLRTLLKERGALGYDSAHSILRACAEALAAAHRCGVVHRDVKPANILLDGDGRAFVTDFGIAKAISEDTPISGSGALLGTPHYLAPELCRGFRADALTDQYSLGVVAYEMLSGRLPFEGDTLHALVAQRLFGDPVPLRQFRPDLPAVLEVAVERAMRRDPAGRFPNLFEMAKLLGAGPLRDPVPRRRTSASAEEDPPTIQLQPVGPKTGWIRTSLAVGVAAGIMALVSMWPLRGTEWGARLGFGRSVSLAQSQIQTLPAVVVTAVPADSSSPTPGESASTAPAQARPQGNAPGAEADARAPEIAWLGPIRHHLEEGSLWVELGRYQDSFEQFRRGLELSAQASRLFGDASALDSLQALLRQALEEARLECMSAGHIDCTAASD